MKIFNGNKRYVSHLVVLLLIWGSAGINKVVLSQESNYRFSPNNERVLKERSNYSYSSFLQLGTAGNKAVVVDSVSKDKPEKIPSPQSVMYKSMIIPGWGQIVNQQAWKVPIVYALIAGVTYYSIHLNKKYNDYKAAYYNRVYPERDQKFGPTPDYINPNVNESSLKSIRNDYRNQRDKAFIGIGLAYGLNVVDAYVFAHLRDFDVSDDLSMNININDGRKFADTDGRVFTEGLYESPVMISLNFELKTQ